MAKPGADSGKQDFYRVMAQRLPSGCQAGQKRPQLAGGQAGAEVYREKVPHIGTILM
jgi:hypothetical protein